MSKKLDYFWNTAGGFLQSAISPILLLVVTRINGLEVSGEFAFAAAVSVVFGAIAMWSGRLFQVSDARILYGSAAYVDSKIIVSLISIFAALYFVAANGYSLDKSSLILLLLASKIVESIADVLFGVLQVNGRLYLAGASLVIKTALSSLAFIIVDTLTKDVVLSALVFLVVTTLVSIAFDFRWAVRVDRSIVSMFEKHTLKQAVSIIKITAPVFATIFLSFFALSVQRYYVDMFHSYDNKYFGILAMPVTLIALLMSFIMQPNVVDMTKAYASGRLKAFTTYVMRVNVVTLVFGLITVVGAGLFGVQVLGAVFGVDLEHYWLHMVVLTSGGVLNSIGIIYLNTLVIIRQQSTATRIMLVSSLLSVLASLPIVIQWGFMGASYAYLGASLLQSVLLSLAYNIRLNREKNKKN